MKDISEGYIRLQSGTTKGATREKRNQELPTREPAPFSKEGRLEQRGNYLSRYNVPSSLLQLDEGDLRGTGGAGLDCTRTCGLWIRQPVAVGALWR